MLEKVELFIDKECISRLCALERGGALSRLHLQMICKILSTIGIVVSKLIRKYLGWEDPKTSPPGHHVSSKILTGSGLHTYIGMVGYCVKDRDEEHFCFVHRKVTPQHIEDGIDEYVKHGTPFPNNMTILTYQNLIEKAATYYKYKMKSQLGSSLPGIILHMLRTGQFYPSLWWVAPLRNGGMEFTRAVSLWKCMVCPQVLEMDDITKIFFEQSSPGSCIRDLG